MGGVEEAIQFAPLHKLKKLILFIHHPFPNNPTTPVQSNSNGTTEGTSNAD